jgi:hypothetical protein
MAFPRRVAAMAIALTLAIPIAALTVTSVQAVPSQSGLYVKDTTTLSTGTGSVRDVATLNDDTIFVASSLGDGTGVLDIVDNTGDNFMPDDDSLVFPSAVLGVAANQVDDTAYFVTGSPVAWMTQASAADSDWVAVTWGGATGQQKFVAVADGGSGDRVMTSPDGITWTARTAAAANRWRSVAWGGPAGQELFVVVAYSGTGNRVMTSPDGITWTARTSAADNDWRSVAWGGPAGQEKFVAVANSGTGNRVMTSTNGIDWTTQTSASNNDWRWVVWGGPAGQEKFVAVAESGTGNRVMTSLDGITWTSQASASDNNWRTVTWGGAIGQEKFVAVADSGSGNRVMTSPDGIAWTAQTSAADNDWSSVIWGGPSGQQKFVAVGSSGSGNRVMVSSDGITWASQASAADNSWRGVTWGGPAGQQKFVAVALTGTGNRVMTSISASTPADGRATLRTYARGVLDDSAPLSVMGTGGSWADVAINNADDTVYVASQDDTRIIALRGNNLDDSRSITLPAGTKPYALAVNQTDDTVYVLSQGSGFTSYLTAMRGSNPDDSMTVSINMSAGQQALAIHPTDDTVYVGGYVTFGQVRQFSPNLIAGPVTNVVLFNDITGLAASDDGRRVYATAGNGSAYVFNTADFTDTASVALGVSSPGAIAVDDFGWAWTGSPSTTTGSRSLVQIGTAPTFTSITPASGPTAGGTTATITGSWFTPATTAAFGVEANLGTTIGTPTSNSMTVTVPPGAAGAAELILTNVAGPSQPLGVNASGTFTYDAAPPPTFPPSPPRDVIAVAGDASATVTWTAPADPGSFPVTTYQVTASPGGKTCLTSTLTCTVAGLTNGTTYTFTAKALNGAGWSAESAPSNAVTPKATARPSILIAGSRDGSTIRVDGATTGLIGSVTPWVRFPGEARYKEGTARPAITDNAFTWSRKVNKKAYVYFTQGAIKSNTVTIAAR